MLKRVFYKDDIDRDGIIRLIRAVLNASDEVIFAYLYGSFIDASTFFYDIDIAVYVKNGKNPHVISVNIKEKIVDVLIKFGDNRFIADDFDVRILNDASYDFVINILIEGLLIVDKNEEVRTSYIEHISMEYRLNRIVLEEALK